MLNQEEIIDFLSSDWKYKKYFIMNILPFLLKQFKSLVSSLRVAVLHTDFHGQHFGQTNVFLYQGETCYNIGKVFPCCNISPSADKRRNLSNVMYVSLCSAINFYQVSCITAVEASLKTLHA